MKQRKLLSQYHPVLYFIAVWLRRIKRKVEWLLSDCTFAKTRNNKIFAFRVKKRQSILLRKLGEKNEQLQINKITNLKIAIKNLDGIIIKPGETFSFCKLVGLPT